MPWSYLIVTLTNKGRNIYENGKLVKSHTKTADMNPLPRNMWNSKGRKMMEDAKGEILNAYGKKNWELVNVKFDPETNEGVYHFKKSKK